MPAPSEPSGSASGTRLDRVVADLTARGLDGEALCMMMVDWEAQAHLPLLHHQANKLAPKFGMKGDDLRGPGWAGLRKAMRNFNPDLGYSFATYAAWRIGGEIRDAVRADRPESKRHQTMLNACRDAEDRFLTEMGRRPTLEDLVRMLPQYSKQIPRLHQLQPATYLEDVVASGESPSSLVEQRDPAELAVRAAQATALHAALAQLSDEDQRVLKAVYFEESTIARMAAALGQTDRQVRGRIRGGIKQLRTILDDWDVERVDAPV